MRYLLCAHAAPIPQTDSVALTYRQASQGLADGKAVRDLCLVAAPALIRTLWKIVSNDL
jgi:hypothetical protein